MLGDKLEITRRPPRDEWPEAGIEQRSQKRLWMGILTRAIEDLLIGLGSKVNPEGLDRTALLREASGWFMRVGRHPGSFEYICAMLELHPPLVRDRVRAILENPPERHRRDDVDNSHLTIAQRDGILTMLDDGLSTGAIVAAAHVTANTVARIRTLGSLVRPCQLCAREFNPVTRAQRFCSVECRRRVEAQNRGPQGPLRVMAPKLCAHCGKEFTPRYRISQIFCDEDCNNRAHRALRQRRLRSSCVVCGREFRGSQGKYCSRQCSMKAMLVSRRLCAAVVEAEEVVTPIEQFWAAILLTAHHDLSRSAELKPLYGEHPGATWTPQQRDEIYDWFFHDDDSACSLLACFSALSLSIERVRAMARETVNGGHAIIFHGRLALSLTSYEPQPAPILGLLNP